MRSSLTLLLASLAAGLCTAHIEKLDSSGDDRCEGVYAAQDIPFSSQESSIDISFQSLDTPALITVLIYNVRDEALFRGDSLGEDFETDLNTDKFVVKESSSGLAPPILNEVVRVNSTAEVPSLQLNYTITQTGFWCVIVFVPPPSL
jgi:hypothetical protein